MSTQELILQIIIIMYEHWIVTLLFIICAAPWNVINIGKPINLAKQEGKS